MATEPPNAPTREEFVSGKIYAEIMHFLEDTRKKEGEREKLRAETAKLQLEAQTFTLRHVILSVAAGAVFLGAAIAAMIALVKAFL